MDELQGMDALFVRLPVEEVRQLRQEFPFEEGRDLQVLMRGAQLAAHLGVHGLIELVADQHDSDPFWQHRYPGSPRQFYCGWAPDLGGSLRRTPGRIGRPGSTGCT